MSGIGCAKGVQAPIVADVQGSTNLIIRGLITCEPDICEVAIKLTFMMVPFRDTSVVKTDNVFVPEL